MFNILQKPNEDQLGSVKQYWKKHKLNWTELSSIEPFIAELVIVQYILLNIRTFNINVEFSREN